MTETPTPADAAENLALPGIEVWEVEEALREQREAALEEAADLVDKEAAKHYSTNPERHALRDVADRIRMLTADDQENQA